LLFCNTSCTSETWSVVHLAPRNSIELTSTAKEATNTAIELADHGVLAPKPKIPGVVEK
jgi:hypothetical protein